MIFSVGHSNLDREAFIGLLAAGPVAEVWDIRSYPNSRWEQFRREQLEQWLPEAGLGYRWVRELGGRRGVHKPDPASPPASGSDTVAKGSAAGSGTVLTGPSHETRSRAAKSDPPLAQASLFAPGEAGRPHWQSEGFEHYMWYMASDEFLAAAGELLLAGRRTDLAMMCAEGLWWRCHRSMVSDFVVYAGGDVVHLQPQRTSHQAAIGDRLDRYEPDVLAAWDRWLASRPV
ncbi:MAG TPA: DUF488 domain-containing protein [Thermoleophilia bacterium]|nr:DUF488 domain-containing protein [Thermoleophilia bacterium]